MSVGTVFGPFFESDVLRTHLAGEDFIVVLVKPHRWSRETQQGCLRVVWKWDMLEMKHQPWDRSDGCANHLHVETSAPGVLRVRMYVDGEERACFSVST